ncbi:Hsp20/alpha crystallin family protein [Methanosarcinales archaeon]|nr:MAG: Hsp20/alpha crystallin family protein [Methanosarcinales archaeon]
MVMRWSPFDELRRLREEIEDVLYGLERTPVWEGEYREPLIDIVDADDEVIITAELPGMRKEDVELTISDNVLTISAKREEEKSEEKENYLYRERVYSGFQRSIRLPVEVDEERAEAKFNNGVLEVRIPKKASEGKRIEIK